MAEVHAPFPNVSVEEAYAHHRRWSVGPSRGAWPRLRLPVQCAGRVHQPAEPPARRGATEFRMDGVFASARVSPGRCSADWTSTSRSTQRPRRSRCHKRSRCSSRARARAHDPSSSIASGGGSESPRCCPQWWARATRPIINIHVRSDLHEVAMAGWRRTRRALSG